MNLAGTIGLRLALLAWGGCLLGPAGCYEGKAGVNDASKPLPVIELAIGEPWEAVVQRSTAKLPPLRSQDVGTIVQMPHRFVFRHPKHQVVFKEAWYARPALTQDRVIGDVGVGLYEGAANAKETWNRLLEVDAKMEAAGWSRDYSDPGYRAQRPADADRLRSDYLRSPSGSGGTYGAWYVPAEGLIAHVNLTKTNSADMDGGLAKHEPRFNVIFYFETDYDTMRWNRRSKNMPE